MKWKDQYECDASEQNPNIGILFAMGPNLLKGRDNVPHELDSIFVSKYLEGLSKSKREWCDIHKSKSEVEMGGTFSGQLVTKGS